MGNNPSRGEYVSLVRAVLGELEGVLLEKNRYYSAEGAFDAFELSGIIGVPVETAILSRFMDKVSRLGVLYRSVELTDPKIHDAALDAMGYLVLFLVRAEVIRAGQERSNKATGT